MLGTWGEVVASLPAGAERRKSDRFPIVRNLNYRLISGRRVLVTGKGETVDVSSKGVLFTAETPLPVGKRLELEISWPAQLDGKCALKLVARGKIVRCRDNRVAVAIEKYEFRTQASAKLPALKAS